MDPVESNTSKEHCIIVSPRQRGNPLIRHFKNIKWVEGETQYDYKITDSIQVLFLSLKYHRMHRGYIITRLKHLRSYKVRNPFIICQVDIAEPQEEISELTIITFTLGYRILLSWGPRESATILEILKLDGHKGLEFLNRKEEKTHLETVQGIIAAIRNVNSTDAVKISRTASTFKEILRCTADTLGGIPGLGKRKVESIISAFNDSFF